MIAYPTEHLSCCFSAVAKNLPELNYVATRSHARLVLQGEACTRRGATLKHVF